MKIHTNKALTQHKIYARTTVNCSIKFDSVELNPKQLESPAIIQCSDNINKYHDASGKVSREMIKLRINVP